MVERITSKGLYHKVYHSRVESALLACETVSSLTHRGEKGRIREILIQQIFRPLLPSDLGVGSGFIISFDGKISHQQDIILYDKAVLPPVLFDQSTGFFPIESVLYTIEVKSKLTRHEIKTSHIAAKLIAQFPLLASDGKPNFDGPRPVSSILALTSSLKGTELSEIKRYDELRKGDPAFIRIICVVGSGYWWLADGTWNEWPEKHYLSEVIGMLGGIMNGIPKMYEKRRTARPPFGAYLIDFGTDITRLLQDLVEIEKKIQLKIEKRSDTIDELSYLQEEIRTISQKAAAVRQIYHEGAMTALFEEINTNCDRFERQVDQLIGDYESR